MPDFIATRAQAHGNFKPVLTSGTFGTGTRSSRHKLASPELDRWRLPRMPVSDFNVQESDASYALGETLRGIAASLENVCIDLAGDIALLPDFPR